MSWFDVSDHKGGVLLLLTALLLEIGFNSASKPLVNDIGGIKRLETLSSFVSIILLFPWILFNILNNNIFTHVITLISLFFLILILSLRIKRKLFNKNRHNTTLGTSI